MATAPINFGSFLVSLMALIESRSEGQLAWVTGDQTVARSLWLNELVEASATDPATVIRCYGGATPAGFSRKLAVSLQQMTRGSDAMAVMAQAIAVSECLLSDAGRPMNHQAVPGKSLVLIDGEWLLADDPDQDWEIKLAMPLQTPGILGGRDDQGKVEASANWDVEFVRVAK